MNVRQIRCLAAPPSSSGIGHQGGRGHRVLLHTAAWLVLLGAPMGCAGGIGGAGKRGAVGSQSASDNLPLTRVRYYESGVAYFERTGQLKSGEAWLTIPEGHLDDAIKSLIVLSESGEIQNVSFDSRLSPAVARARAGLPADVEAALGFHALLDTLKGARVELRLTRGRLRGTLVDVVDIRDDLSPRGSVSASDADGDAVFWSEDDLPQSNALVTVMTDEGRISAVPVRTIAGVRPLDPDVRQRLGLALSAGRRTQGVSYNQVGVKGTGGGVTLGYLVESPVWRLTYRLVMAKPGADGVRNTTLQAWALVHNDTDEAWQGVVLEVVDGRPDSFMFPLAAPRYERRELKTPDRELSSVPQLLEGNADQLWGDFADGIELGNVGLVGHGGGSGSGSGYGSGTGGGSGRSAGLPRAGQSDLLALGDLAATKQAKSEEQASSVLFTAAEPIDLAPQHSAMVPIIQAPVQARAVAWFPSLQAAPRAAIALINTSGRTLPTGPIAVYLDGGFAGESVLDRLKPDEVVLADIAEERDTELRIIDAKTTRERKKVVFRNGMLEAHYTERVERSLAIRNRSGQVKEVLMTLPTGRNATVEGTDRTDWDAARSSALGIIDVPAAKEIERVIVTTEGLVERRKPEQLSREYLAELAEEATLDAATKEQLRPLLAAVEEREQHRRKAEALSADQTRVLEDLARLKDTLGALGDAGAAERNPLVRRAVALEDELGKLRTEAEKHAELIRPIEAKINTKLASFAPVSEVASGAAAPTTTPR